MDRKLQARRAWLWSASASAFLAAGATHAQTYNPNPGGTRVTTYSFTDSLTFAPATTAMTTVNLYSTEIVGTLNNGAALYDQTFAAAFASATVQGGVSAARAAITTAGGPGVVIAAPVLASHTVTTSSTSSSVYSLDPSTPVITGSPRVNTPAYVTQTEMTTFGPATVNAAVTPQPGSAGDYRACAAASALPSTTKPVCGPTPASAGVFSVNAGQEDLNINLNTAYLIDTATTETDTTTTTDVYDINGMTVQAIGMVHAAVGEAGFDQTQRFGRRLLDDRRLEAGGGAGTATDPNVWLEPYGYVSSTGHQGDIPSNTRDGWGLNGGVGYDLTSAWRVGAAIDYGQDTIKESAAGEYGHLDLTQLGLYGSWRAGPWFANLAGTYGWGAASTSVTPAFVNETALSSYALTTGGASAETGRRASFGFTTVTPTIGVAWDHVQSGGFTETGSLLALTGRSTGVDRYEGWLGLTDDTKVTAGAGAFDVVVYGRLLGIAGDQRVDLPVTFVGGTTPLTIQGVSTGSLGADLGASVGYRIASKVDVALTYDARLRDRYAAQTAGLGVKVAF